MKRDEASSEDLLGKLPSVVDVAEYILQRLGTVRAMKLQKLVYYAQSWSLVWAERPLFSNRIEAWVRGPVAPELFSRHAGRLVVESVAGNPAALAAEARELIDEVLSFYGHMSSEWLSSLAHAEEPWRAARKGLGAEERSSVEITHKAMAEYYETQPCGGHGRPLTLPAESLGDLLAAEEELRNGDSVEWTALRRELLDKSRAKGSLGNEGRPLGGSA